MAEFAMSGVTLRNRLQCGTLQTAEALAIAVEAGRALALAHAAGQIHGNLTSASIMLQHSTALTLTLQGFGQVQRPTEDIYHLAPHPIARAPPPAPPPPYHLT